MKRRDFLKWASAAGAAVATGTAEPAEATPLSSVEMSEYLTRLDHQLDGISRGRTIDNLFPGLRPPPEAEQVPFNQGDDLFRKSMRSLLLVGLVHDLPEKSRLHPGVQERLKRSLPEMDESVLGIVDMLQRLTPADRLDIAAAIDADPGLPMRVIEAIDREGRELGVSTKRRMHLRTLGSQVAWRIKHQPLSTVIDDQIDRVQRVMAQHAAHPELAERMAQIDVLTGRRMAMSSDSVALPEGTPEERGQPGKARQKTPLERAQKGRQLMGQGGAVLGVGAVITGVSVALVLTTNFWFVFAVTAGVLLVVAGLIVLLVGAVMRYRADRELEKT
jgi:hypothetical protein